MVVGVQDPFDQAERLGSIGQFAGGVMFDQQRFGHSADGRFFVCASYDEQQLMLGVREPDLLGFCAAPGIELSQTGPEFQETSIGFVGQHDFRIIYRATIFMRL